MADSDSDASPSDADDVSLPAERLRLLSVVIPGYTLDREISRGGQAVVYKGTQDSTGATVAIKVLLAGPLAEEATRKRFQREARILATLDHPNIVPIIDHGQTAQALDFLVMKFIAGRSLDEYMADYDRDGPPPESVLRLFIKVCDAINVAHLRGITHRDLSPSNIRIDERNEPYVLDFGLARTAFDRFINQSKHDISVTGQFLGKLAYASPEQARGDPEKIDIRTDVYSLGVMLYQIVTGGRYPYEIVGAIADVLNNIIHREPMPPSVLLRQSEMVRGRLRQRTPAVNETVELIVLKALQKNPDDRYQSAGELSRDLTAYLAGRPISAAIALPRPPQHRPVRGSRDAIAVLALVVILSAAVFVWTHFWPATTAQHVGDASAASIDHPPLQSGVPGNLHQVRAGPSSIDLAWDYAGPPVTRFVIEAKNGRQWDEVGRAFTGSRTYRIADLPDDTAYQLRVTAIADNRPPVSSPTIRLATATFDPIDFRAMWIAEQRLRLAWDIKGRRPTRFMLFAYNDATDNWDSQAEIDASARSYELPLTPGVPFRFMLVSIGQSGNSPGGNAITVPLVNPLQAKAR